MSYNQNSTFRANGPFFPKADFRCLKAELDSEFGICLTSYGTCVKDCDCKDTRLFCHGPVGLVFFFITVGIFSAVIFHYGRNIPACKNPVKRGFFHLIFDHNSDKITAKLTAVMRAKKYKNPTSIMAKNFI
jgi:hypothetical protein